MSNNSYKALNVHKQKLNKKQEKKILKKEEKKHTINFVIFFLFLCFKIIVCVVGAVCRSTAEAEYEIQNTQYHINEKENVFAISVQNEKAE